MAEHPAPGSCGQRLERMRVLDAQRMLWSRAVYSNYRGTEGRIKQCWYCNICLGKGTVREDDDFREAPLEVTTINIQLMKRRQNRGMLPKLSNSGVHVQSQKSWICLRMHRCPSHKIINHKPPRTEKHPGLWLRQWARDVAMDKTSHRPLTASPTDRHHSCATRKPSLFGPTQSCIEDSTVASSNNGERRPCPDMHCCCTTQGPMWATLTDCGHYRRTKIACLHLHIGLLCSHGSRKPSSSSASARSTSDAPDLPVAIS